MVVFCLGCMKIMNMFALVLDYPEGILSCLCPPVELGFQLTLILLLLWGENTPVPGDLPVTLADFRGQCICNLDLVKENAFA